MGSQSSRLVNGQDSLQQNSGVLRNQYMNQSGNSIGSMTDTQNRGNFINTVFQWTFGATTVELTGTFNNWENPIPLKKMENNCFEIILKLSPGVYQYKYIVDGQWRFSTDDPTCKDENGNMNNIIDTTNIERSMSLIGRNVNSARFLMGSQNNSIGFMQTNSSSTNNSQLQQVRGAGTQQPPQQQQQLMALTPQQQLIYAQLSQQQQQQFFETAHMNQQQQQYGINNNNPNQAHLTQLQQQQLFNYANVQQQLQQQLQSGVNCGMNAQQLMQQLQMNPQLVQQSYERMLQQQQQQWQQQQQLNLSNHHQFSQPQQQQQNAGQIPPAGLLVPQVSNHTTSPHHHHHHNHNPNSIQGNTGLLLPPTLVPPNNLHSASSTSASSTSQQSTNPANTSAINAANINAMQAMYLRAIQQQGQQQYPQQPNSLMNHSGFDRSSLIIRAHILQQNQTNFDSAFKDAAPLLPPHLLDVSALKIRNAKNISIQRVKEPHDLSSYKSVFGSSKNEHGIEQEEHSNLEQDNNNNNHGSTLKNTAGDDAEVLMHVFQPSHSLTPVDHVTLNHVGIDALRHSEKYNVYCITQRFKTKYTTYQFYTSKYDTQIIL